MCIHMHTLMSMSRSLDLISQVLLLTLYPDPDGVSGSSAFQGWTFWVWRTVWYQAGQIWSFQWLQNLIRIDEGLMAEPNTPLHIRLSVHVSHEESILQTFAADSKRIWSPSRLRHIGDWVWPSGRRNLLHSADVPQSNSLHKLLQLFLFQLSFFKYIIAISGHMCTCL